MVSQRVGQPGVPAGSDQLLSSPILRDTGSLSACRITRLCSLLPHNPLNPSHGGFICILRRCLPQTSPLLCQVALTHHLPTTC